jgi:hypothetical protein
MYFPSNSNRKKGRTSRMVKDALVQCLLGFEVGIVFHKKDMFIYAKELLFRFGLQGSAWTIQCTYTNTLMEHEDGGSITLLIPTQVNRWKKGRKDAVVFFDHHVFEHERRVNKLLEMYSVGGQSDQVNRGSL